MPWREIPAMNDKSATLFETFLLLLIPREVEVKGTERDSCFRFRKEVCDLNELMGNQEGRLR